jgi:predicted ester cyclase
MLLMNWRIQILLVIWQMGTIIGLNIYKQAISATLAAIPDLQVIIEDQFAEGDKVATRWQATGTPQVEFAGIKPNG